MSEIDPRWWEFLRTREWFELRYFVLKRDGPRCARCRRTPANGVSMNIDHIKPRKFYPELALDPDNCQVLCAICNKEKGNSDMTDYRKLNGWKPYDRETQARDRVGKFIAKYGDQLSELLDGR